MGLSSAGLEFGACRRNFPLFIMDSNPAAGDFSLAGLAGAALRPAAEFGLLLADPVYWGRGVRRGDGRPVLVLPGLFAGDAYLQPLRERDRRASNVEVQGSHIGLAFNPAVYRVLARMLAAPDREVV